MAIGRGLSASMGWKFSMLLSFSVVYPFCSCFIGYMELKHIPIKGDGAGGCGL